MRNEPMIQPGQIWLVQHSSATSLSALDRAALTGANVVLYDRLLAPLVARVLPIGSYAEPLPRNGAVASAISPRALQFAAEGWSVVQLVEARPGWRERLQTAPEVLVPPGGADDLPVLAIAKTGADRSPKGDACWRRLPELVGEFGDDDPPTLIFGPLPVRHPAQTRAFTANGLAG